MRKLFTLCLFLLTAQFIQAQHPTCDGNRYSNFVFPAVDTTFNVKFGENTTFGGTNQELFMDIFEPAGDQAAMRPAIVVAFGGAFVAGERSDVHGICNYFASKGYVTAAIDYRLYDNFFFSDSSQAVDAVIKAVGDMKAAVRFLREDAATTNTYRIDPDYIYGGGVSAGAITACHVAYLDTADIVPTAIQTAIDANGGDEGNSSTNTQYSSEIRGVLNYSGALKDANWMDANEAIIYSAHDDGDNIVPYNSRSVFVGIGVSIFLEGSLTLTDRAQSLGIPNDLYTVQNSTGHVSYLSSNFADILNASSALFFGDVCPGTVGLEDNIAPSILLFPNPVQNELAVEVPGTEGFSVELMGLDGKMIWQGRSEMKAQRFQLGDLPAGLYLARVMSDSGDELRQKVWKR